MMASEKSKVVFKEIPVYLLKRASYQPRQDFPEASLHELAATIKREGVLEPLLVRPLNDGDYEIVAGERRWRAAQLAFLHEVPCLVKNYTDEQAARIALIENTHREHLNLVSEAQAIQKMIEAFDYTHEEVALMLGKARPVITNLLRLLKLDPRVQEFLRTERLTEAHGKLLAGVAMDKQYPLALTALAKHWTTRSLEAAIKKLPGVKASVGVAKPDIYIVKIERKLADRLGQRVVLNLDKSKAGSLNIFFGDLDQLQGVLEKIGYDENTD